MDDDWLLSRLAECVQDEVTQVAPLTANVSFCDGGGFSESKTRTTLHKWNFVMSKFRGFDENILSTHIVSNKETSIMQQEVNSIHQY